MSAKQIKIEWIHEGFEEILCSSGTKNEVKAAAGRIRAKANRNNRKGGKGYWSGARIGKAFGSQRALGFVYSADEKSAAAESEDKALSRAVSG